MLKITMYIEDLEASVYDADGMFYDETDDVWYCVDEDGIEYWYDEESEEWIECEYEEEVKEDAFDDFCYYEE
jgi:hypothetical protein